MPYRLQGFPGLVIRTRYLPARSRMVARSSAIRGLASDGLCAESMSDKARVVVRNSAVDVVGEEEVQPEVRFGVQQF